jgi:hypothetical protein
VIGAGGGCGGVRRTCDAEAAGLDVVQPGHADPRGRAQLVHVVGLGLPPLRSLACHPARTGRMPWRRGGEVEVNGNELKSQASQGMKGTMQ